MPQNEDAAAPHTEDLRWTAGVFAIAATVYLATLCPTVYVMDSPELVAVVETFGVAHPPGYPLFTMLYGTLSSLVPLGEPALRANVVTALVGAAAVAVLFRAARALGVPRVPSAAGALAIAVARDWWVQANSTEVYALDGLLVACALLAAVRVVREPARAGGWSWLGLACGLAVGHRAPNVVMLAPVVVWAELARRRAGAPAGRLARFAIAGLATTVVFLYLPLAAARGPAMNMGDPSDPERLWIVLTAGPYVRHLATTTLDLSLGRLALLVGRLPFVAPLAVAAAIYAVWKTPQRGAARALVVVVLLDVLFVSLYNVPDVEGLVQPALCALAVLAAMGVHAGLARVRAGRTAAWLVLAGALLPAAWTWHEADLSGVRTVETYGSDLLASAAPASMVLCYDDTARNAMVFRQVVHGERMDVAVVDPTAPLAWHLAETRRRAPAFETFGVDAGEGWVRQVAGRLVQDGTAGRLYATDIEGIDLEFVLGPALAARVALVPAGLLYRIVVLPPGADPVRTRADLAIENSAGFWQARSLPAPATSRSDPQLGFISVRYARPRFLLAVAYVMAALPRAAEPHLAAIGASDVDRLEDAVIANLRTIGMDPPDWNAASRARQGLEAIRGGAGRDDILRALAPR